MPGTRCVHRGRQEATRSPSVCRCLRVSRSGYYARTGRRPSRTMRHRKEPSALIEWVFNSSRATLRAAAASHAARARRGVETSPEGCAPPVRSQGPPGGGPAERTRRHYPRAAGPGDSAPTWSGAGSRRQLAGSEVGGRHPLASSPGRGSICLATVPGLLHEESIRVRDWGDCTRHQSWPARPSTWRPAGARTRQERRFSTRTGAASTPPPSSPGT